jgi:nucleoside-diphosphate-sugar epimerase
VLHRVDRRLPEGRSNECRERANGVGLLDAPGTGNELPNLRYGSTRHVADAARALVAALAVPSGIYNVCRDGEHVSNERFERVSGWRPER